MCFFFNTAARHPNWCLGTSGGKQFFPGKLACGFSTGISGQSWVHQMVGEPEGATAVCREHRDSMKSILLLLPEVREARGLTISNEYLAC